MDFRETIKLGRDCTCWIQFLVLLVDESSRMFYVLKCLYEFVFEFIGRVFFEDPVGVGVKNECALLV